MSSQPGEPRNPYPGLRPFQEADAAFFVGREALLRRLDQQIRVAPINVLFARRGMGKSSFLSCRLIPHFAETGGVEYVNEWGSAAPETLIALRLEALEAAGSGAEIPLLVLDQFEDVFKRPGDLRPLWRLLSRIVHSREPQARLLISMREEWLGAWWDVADYLEQAVDAMVRLNPLDDRELRAAILEPARREGSVDADDDLARRMIDDLRVTNLFGNGTYVEPGLIQLICNRLWSEAYGRRQSRSMSVGLYKELGGAPRLVREHVWRHVATPLSRGGAFVPADRALWVGLSRHLTVARGIKDVVTPSELAARLRIDDLGIGGRAVVAGCAGRRSRKYLEQLPEKREGTPPQPLMKAITRVLERAVTVNLMKRQAVPPDDRGESRYELCHDSLAELLQEFCGEFELMVQRRRRRGVQIAVAVLLVVIAIPFVIASWDEQSGWRLLWVAPPFSVFYLATTWASIKLYSWLFERGRFFLVRRALAGTVPLPIGSNFISDRSAVAMPAADPSGHRRAPPAPGQAPPPNVAERAAPPPPS